MHEPAEPVRRLDGRKHADHGADRVADEHDVAQVERPQISSTSVA